MNPVQTPTRLADYFLRLADDAALMADQQRNPRATMAAAGLTEEQITRLLAGGIEGVRQAVESEIATDPLRRHVVTSPRMTVHTPTPDDGEPSPPEPPPQPEPERS